MWLIFVLGEETVILLQSLWLTFVFLGFLSLLALAANSFKCLDPFQPNLATTERQNSFLAPQSTPRL